MIINNGYDEGLEIHENDKSFVISYRTDTRRPVYLFANSYRVQSKAVLKSSNMNKGDCNENIPALPVRPILCVCV